MKKADAPDAEELLVGIARMPEVPEPPGFNFTAILVGEPRFATSRRVAVSMPLTARSHTRRLRQLREHCSPDRGVTRTFPCVDDPALRVDQDEMRLVGRPELLRTSSLRVGQLAP